LQVQVFKQVIPGPMAPIQRLQTRNFENCPYRNVPETQTGPQ